MKKVQDTRGYERYMALDIHREYILVGAWNAEKDWVLTPRRVSTERFPEWAKKNIRAGDIVVLETTTNVWATYDIVAPLAGRVLVANAAEVEEIAKARVKTDKEDIKKLLKILIGGIVPEVWVPPMEVRELRAFISYRGRLVKTSATPALACWCKCDPQSPAKPAAQAQSEIVRDRTARSGLVGSAERYQFLGKDADPSGAGTAAGS
jgi:hypothetical protein